MKHTKLLVALACTILLLIPAIPAQALGASCTAEGEVTLTLNAQTDDGTTISILGSGSGSVTCQVSQSACGVSAYGDVQVGGFASAGFLTITAVFTGNGSVFLECPPGGGERMTGGGGIGAPRGHVRLGTVLTLFDNKWP